MSHLYGLLLNQLQSFGKLMVGLCRSGCWGCFDEFNRIDVSVLSVVTTQIKSIQNALQAKATLFQVRLSCSSSLFVSQWMLILTIYMFSSCSLKAKKPCWIVASATSSRWILGTQVERSCRSPWKRCSVLLSSSSRISSTSAKSCYLPKASSLPE